MHTRRLIQSTVLAASAATLLAQTYANAQTWQKALDFQLVPGQASLGFSLAADDFGNVFAGGYATVRRGWC